ncbi:ribosomal protein S6 [Phanerochaete sordida]|uniref:Ribosomal protein S6 n=1 Tax=Phanerochaete sordida TaxID=48140 RepID=A0A9P3GIU6_9APHY|nr:ribosomal protein S6 [Phanerochaete sordida]
MPFYQMLCITQHLPEYSHIKQLVSLAAKHVMDRGGVVRKLNSWGTMTLPQRMHRRRKWHDVGDYWTMNFDASPKTLHSLDNILKHDPRVIRWTMIKLGEKVEDVVQPPSKTFKS